MLQVAIIGGEDSPLVDELHSSVEGSEFVGLPPDTSPEAHVIGGEADVLLAFPENFDADVRAGRTGALAIYFKGTQDGRNGSRRIAQAIKAFEARLLEERLGDRAIDPGFIDPVRIDEIDVATLRERRAESFGGIFACFVILFGLAGAMAPSVDLGAGEKERGTLETLLTAPARLLDIVTGKLLVVVLISVTATVLSPGRHGNHRRHRVRRRSRKHHITVRLEHDLAR